MEPYLEGFILRNMTLAKSVARAAWRKHYKVLELEELESIALVALVQSANRWESYCAERNFDPYREDYFKVYVRKRTHGAIVDTARSVGPITRTVWEKAREVDNLVNDGKSIEEIADLLDIDTKEVRDRIASVARGFVSIDEHGLDFPASTDLEDDVIESLNSSSQGIVEAVVMAVERLPYRSRVILTLKYFSGKSLTKIAEELELGPSLVSKTHAKAVALIYKYVVLTMGSE